MPNTYEFEIACYLSWAGAEAVFPFETKERYDAARAVLGKIAFAHLSGKELPFGFPRSVTDYYVIDARDRAAFQDVMRAA